MEGTFALAPAEYTAQASIHTVNDLQNHMRDQAGHIGRYPTN
jgi:hypothetical protein